MIRFSKKTKYALKCLIHLAIYQENSVIAVQSISQIQNIPEKFLCSILSELKKNGWVKSQQGPKGGYCLSDKAEEISIKEIIEKLELKTNNKDALNSTYTKESKISELVITSLLQEIDNILSQNLSSLTLKEIKKRYLKLLNSQSQFYVI